jgi:SRSO17 transposase
LIIDGEWIFRREYLASKSSLIKQESMMNLTKNPVLDEFFSETPLNLDSDTYTALKNMVSGLIINGRGSIKNIAENTVDGLNVRQLNRAIHELNMESRSIFRKVYASMQSISGLAEKADGVMSLDEHIISKTGKEIEGVDYFYSPAEDKTVLGLSMISTHYYGGKIEYPTDFLFFRRLEELESYKKEADYKKKNEIARELIRANIEAGSPCKYWAVDCYFLTKENVKELQSHQLFYVSKIKRNWKCTYQRTHYTVTDLQATIPDTEYELTTIKSPKTRKDRYFKVASRSVFIPKIGNHVLLFLRELEWDTAGHLIEKYPGEWICLVSNLLTSPKEQIMEIYAKRWAIETSYRDETQYLKLAGCMWRDIEGQYCFITLVFIAYILLVWAWYEGYLDPYNAELRTLGQRQAAFKRFSEELFAEWIVNLKHQCKQCKMANIIYELTYKGEKGSNLYKQASLR